MAAATRGAAVLVYIMAEFTLKLLNFMMFIFRSASPLVIIPAALLAVSGSFQLFRRFLAKS